MRSHFQLVSKKEGKNWLCQKKMRHNLSNMKVPAGLLILYRSFSAVLRKDKKWACSFLNAVKASTRGKTKFEWNGCTRFFTENKHPRIKSRISTALLFSIVIQESVDTKVITVWWIVSLFNPVLKLCMFLFSVKKRVQPIHSSRGKNIF